MITSKHFSAASTRFLVAGLVASMVLVMALPSFAHAATYAYVNKSGEVSTVTANDWMTAIATAFNIATHSGVLLLDSQADMDIVGDSVGGV